MEHAPVTAARRQPKPSAVIARAECRLIESLGEAVERGEKHAQAMLFDLLASKHAAQLAKSGWFNRAD
ncbi:hypothetical protein [Methylocella sp.]|jgi:hypothetical protein|uniref:hypothetical protein n=1 Tax=Methylocella sp. TaxID=1978226 RepID=UPI003C1AA44C